MQQVIDYINKKVSDGLTLDVITSNLLSAGWSKELVDKAIFIHKNPDVPVPETFNLSRQGIPTSSTKHGPSVELNLWDAFEHILMFISLFVFVIALIFMLNQFVDIFLPDPLKYDYRYGDYYGYSGNWYNEAIKVPLAMIIVSFPFFAFMFIRIQKRTHLNPELRKMLLRKILIYLTLIVTFVTLLYNVIAIIFNFLNGDLSINFFAHFAVSTSICAIVFGYFVRVVKDDQKIIG